MGDFDYTAGVPPTSTELAKLPGDFDYTAAPPKITSGGDGPAPERTLLVSVFINE